MASLTAPETAPAAPEAPVQAAAGVPNSSPDAPVRVEVPMPRALFDRMIEATTPLGRPQTPQDVGNAVAFFASAQARNITGQSLNVDGGRVMS